MTFVFAVFGWIIFRAESLSQALDFFAKMFTGGFFAGFKMFGKKELLLCFVLIVIEWVQRDKQHALQFKNCFFNRYTFVRYCVYFLIIMVILVFSGSKSEFIYFQF